MAEETLKDIPLTDIFSDDDFNCRGHVTPATVMELAEDLAKNGLIQPIVIQPWTKVPAKRYRIVVGHRRYAAAKQLKWETIKCRVMEGLSEDQALVLNLRENLSREDLNIVQEANALKRFIKLGWEEKRIAKELGVYKKWVVVRLALLMLPDEIQRRAEAGFLTQHQLEDIIAKPSLADQLEYTRKCVDWKLKGERGSFKLTEQKKRNIFAKGEARSKEDIFDVQSLIQDTLDENSHPAAVALAWAAGVISLNELYEHLDKWAREKGKVFIRPEEE